MRQTEEVVVNRLHQSLATFAANLDPAELRALGMILRLAASPNPRSAHLNLRAMLSKPERDMYNKICAERLEASHLMGPQLVVVMKATRLCNLRCTYCHSWRDGPGQTMSFEILCRATRDSLAPPNVRRVEFVWHGGEVTLLPVEFFRKAVWLQHRFCQPGQVVANSVQTNAVLRNAELYRFFRQHDFSVGVSLDGPPEVHDRRRLDRAGRPTSLAVREGLRAIRDAGLPYGVLMVIDDEVIRCGPRRILDYLAQLEAESVGVLNVIPANDATDEPSADSYISVDRYVSFLCELFHEWWHGYRNIVCIREFESLIGAVRGGKAGLCYFAGNCMGRYITVEPNGDVAACDKYVGDAEFKFGNLMDAPLDRIIRNSPQLVQEQQSQGEALHRASSCRWFEVCSGGCPHDRRLTRLYQPSYRSGCCGYAPLLDAMKSVLS